MNDVLALLGEGHSGLYYILGFLFWVLIPMLLYRSMRKEKFTFLDYVFLVVIFFFGWVGLLVAWLVNWFGRR